MTDTEQPRETVDMTFKWDPGLTRDQVAERLGPEWALVLDMAVVDMVVACNPLKVRALVARHLGYDVLAERWETLARLSTELRTQANHADETTPVNPLAPPPT